MTEAEYKRIRASSNHPVYDEGDARCREVDMLPPTGGFLCVHEAPTIDQAQRLSNNPAMKFAGGIRFDMGGIKVVHAYFWERRLG